MNILSINKFFWKKGGSEAVFFTEKELFEKQEHNVVPFSMTHNKNLASPYSNYFVDEVDYSRGGFLAKMQAAFKIIYSFDAKRKMKHLLSEQAIDIAHFHIFQHQISPSVFAPLREKKIPIVLTLHDLKPICPNYQMYVNGDICERCKGRKFYHAFLNRCTKGSYFKSLINTIEMYFHYFMGYYQNVDKYIAVSQFHRNKMIENGFAPEQIALLPNCIDPNQFYFSENDDNYVLFIGRLSREKGVKTLIDAAKLSPEINIKIVGTGPDEEKLKQQVEQQKLLNVKFSGYQSGQNLIDLIAHSSFTVITSIVYENCPMSILESFAMGKAVIGSRIGGIPELLDEGIDGLTFIPGDAQSLADQMSILWKDKPNRQAMGKRGRDKVVNDFNPDKHYQQLLSIYQQALSDKGSL
jgi:glycosyltransferase involved in cell wall biosynthesis